MGSSKQGPREETYRFCACNMQVWIWRLSIHSSTALLVFIYSIQLYTPMSLCVFGFVPSDFILRLLTHGPHKPLFLLSILSYFLLTKKTWSEELEGGRCINHAARDFWQCSWICLHDWTQSCNYYHHYFL